MLKNNMNMKTKLFLLTMIIPFLLIAGMGCEQELSLSDLYHTWKFERFENVKNNSFEKADPSDCENCYRITFVKDGKFSGFTASNSFFGEYQISGLEIKITHFEITEIFEIGNGEKYVQTMLKIENFEIVKNKLKLYYNQGQNYLLFHLISQSVWKQTNYF